MDLAQSIIESRQGSTSPGVTTLVLVGLSFVLAFFLYLVFTIKNEPVSSVKTSSQQHTNSLTNDIKKQNQIYDDRRKSDINALASLLEQYKARNKVYPNSLSDLLPNYIDVLPTDPQTGIIYAYQAQLDQKSYILTAYLSIGSYTVSRN